MVRLWLGLGIELIRYVTNYFNPRFLVRIVWKKFVWHFGSPLKESGLVFCLFCFKQKIRKKKTQKNQKVSLALLRVRCGLGLDAGIALIIISLEGPYKDNKIYVCACVRVVGLFWWKGPFFLSSISISAFLLLPPLMLWDICKTTK